VAARAALRASNSRRRSSSASRCISIEDIDERALGSGRSLLAVAFSAEFSRVSVDGGARASRVGGEDEGRPARLESGRSLLDVALSAEF